MLDIRNVLGARRDPRGTPGLGPFAAAGNRQVSSGGYSNPDGMSITPPPGPPPPSAFMRQPAGPPPSMSPYGEPSGPMPPRSLMAEGPPSGFMGMMPRRGPLGAPMQFGQPPAAMPMSSGFTPARGLSMQGIRARREAAQQFGGRAASQGQFGPGMRGEAGGFQPILGRRPVAFGSRMER